MSELDHSMRCSRIAEGGLYRGVEIVRVVLFINVVAVAVELLLLQVVVATPSPRCAAAETWLVASLICTLQVQAQVRAQLYLLDSLIASTSKYDFTIFVCPVSSFNELPLW